MPALATWVGKTMPWRRERAVRSELLRNPAILAIGGLAVLGGALLYFVFESSLQQRSRDQAIQYTEQVIGDLRALQTRVTDSETGQRGYLLTGDAKYLAPYDAAPTAIDGLLRRLRSAFSGQFGDSVELVRLDQVGRLIASKLDDLNRSVVLQRSGNATDALALVRSNTGLFIMGSLRDAIAAMVAEETDRLSARLDARRRQQNFAITVSALGGAFAILLMLAAGVLAVLFMRANRNMQAALQSAHDAAVSADRAKSQFLATASHDLRQPLHAMNLFISALRRRVSGEEATKLVANMASAAESMQMMFNSLLDVSKLHAGVVVPAMADFPVEEVFVRLRNAFSAPAAAKGIALDIAPATCLVHSDPGPVGEHPAKPDFQCRPLHPPGACRRGLPRAQRPCRHRSPRYRPRHTGRPDRACLRGIPTARHLQRRGAGPWARAGHCAPPGAPARPADRAAVRRRRGHDILGSPPARRHGRAGSGRH